jgi:hypothetical protein
MSGGQAAGNSGQHTVLPDPATGQSGGRERLDRPAASHQPTQIVHAAVYAAIFVDGLRTQHSRESTDVLAQRANVSAALAAKFYQPWPTS